MHIEKLKPTPWDERRNLIIPGEYNATVAVCANHFLAVGNAAIKDHDAFYVALSGGSTPKAIFETLCTPPYVDQIDWTKVWLFWSDERSVPPENPENNYHVAMEIGFKKLVPAKQIHRMQAEQEIEKNALAYETKIKTLLKGRPFDLIILGLGEDGHTASLFPNTEALHAKGRLVVANFVTQKNTWRMTFTLECINQAKHTVLWVLGAGKKHILAEVLKSPLQVEHFPSQGVGTKEHKALIIADEAAAAALQN